jgi:hypothetical protein
MIGDLLQRAIGKFEGDWKYLRAAALTLGAGVAAPVAAHAALLQAVNVYTMTPRRIEASLTVLAALIGAVLGVRALAHLDNGRRPGMVATLLALIGLVGGGVVVATAKGGLGTGNGLGGGFVAIVVGLIGIALGGMALAHSRPTS